MTQQMHPPLRTQLLGIWAAARFDYQLHPAGLGGAKHPLLCLLGPEIAQAWHNPYVVAVASESPPTTSRHAHRARRWSVDALATATHQLILSRDMFRAGYDGPRLVAQRDVEALVDRAELNSEQAEKVITSLGTSEVLFGLETVELLDQPKIELRDGNACKDCATLSTGQKCTAILPILLMDSDRPLLIDQPEDNLDNRFIFEAVVDSIRKIKPRRQLIFVTHNPNIPVLGDVEKVFVLDSNGSAARKADEGSVDRCKADIVTLLEGGEEAFKRRKARYAY